MKVVIYPADDYGCGHFRCIWPGEYLRDLEHDVEIIRAKDRKIEMNFHGDRLVDVQVDETADVFVFQRTTDDRVVQMVKWLRDRGKTVVIDVDDDLSAIHPANPAWTFLDPNRAKHEVQDAMRERKVDPRHASAAFEALNKQYHHSWNHLLEACKYASMVTVSTPGLLERYARHGRGKVLPNYLPDQYYGHPHIDSDIITWPAALHSHPNDPDAVGNAIRRITQDGAEFSTIGKDNLGAGASFGLPYEPTMLDDVPLTSWPFALAHLGIGIAPLADTLFNARKSWLKPLELSAAGVPWVGSPRREYVRLHRMGAGLLAKDQRDWYKHLRRLVDSSDYRAEVAARGREVADRLRLRNHVEIYWDTWMETLDRDRRTASQSA